MKEKEKFEEIELQEIQREEKEALVPIKETDGKSYAMSGDIDVGDECWRRNLVATTLRCW